MSTEPLTSDRPDRVTLALRLGRANLVVLAARHNVAGHHHDTEPCGLCAALADHDRIPRKVP